MSYIVIETFPDISMASIVTDDDGYNKIFATFEEAQVEAEACQDGIVIKL